MSASTKSPPKTPPEPAAAPPKPERTLSYGVANPKSGSGKSRSAPSTPKDD